MNPTKRITPIISSLENSLNNCIEVLEDGGDVAQVANALTMTQQALSKLRPVIDLLAQMEDEKGTALANIHSLAVELLVSLDESTACYNPRPHAENVELIYSILECYPATPTTLPDNAMNPLKNKEIH